jgi:cytochrome c oxidase subunit 3
LSDAVAHAGAHHGPHGHGHAHHPALQHHFDTMEQQQEAGTFGMWLFLVTEILFFGGLFFAYALYRMWYFEAFAAASRTLDLWLGGFNTAVLIGSSLTMALAVRAAQTNQRRATVNWILLTMFLGAVFLGVKVIEYSDKFEHHHVPGPSFVWAEHGGEGAAAAGGHEAAAPAGGHDDQSDPTFQRTTQIYFSLYFTMTGLHALHMVIGFFILATVAWMAHKGRFDDQWYAPVEMTGLYWHFVDIVWIFLFPLLYLVERHT